MQKQPAPKAKKKPKKTERSSARSAARSTASSSTRSTTRYHTPEELERLEAGAREKAHVEDQSTGFALQRADGSFEVRDDMAEQLTEEFLVSALSGEETHKILDDDTDEEALGPIIETSAANVFGDAEDEMNSDETLKESLPTAGNWTIPPKGRVS